MTASPVVTLVSEEQFAKLSKDGGMTVLNFWAPWAAQCSQMNDVFGELAQNFSGKMAFIQIEAEAFPDLSLRFAVDSVPTFIFVQSAKALESLSGANAPALSAACEKYSKMALLAPLPAMPLASSSAPFETITATATSTSPKVLSPDQLNEQLQKLVKAHPAMLFMKGTPSQPRCGFSKTIIEILTTYKCDYGTFNILADDQVRQGLKEFVSWPTYPMLFVNGELVGGLDIVKELDESGELKELLPQKENLTDRLKRLVNENPVVLFMKGEPSAPRCGFSRQIIELLTVHNVKFGTFDILSDDEVRQGLKEYSAWPTYPQLYMNGELVGGLDIVKELIDANEFDALVPALAKQ